MYRALTLGANVATAAKRKVSPEPVKTRRAEVEEVEIKKAKVAIKRVISDIEDAVVKKLKPAKEKSGTMDYLGLLEEVSNVVKLNSISLSE